MDNKLEILNYLAKNLDARYTMHELSKILDIPYASFYRTIKSMEDLLLIDDVGKSKVLQLNKENKIIKAYLSISSDYERKEFIKLSPYIKKIYEELETDDIVILFGSYAKGKQTSKSDIDLLIINKQGKKNISFFKYEILFKVKINPIIITQKEFRFMLKDINENVGKQVLKNHIILNNAEKFWRLVL